MVTLSAPANLLTNIETSNGGERISTTLQSDYTFTLGMRGYSWDKANGGSSPDNQSIANGDFWDSTATSHKHTAGTLIIGSAADLVPLTEEAAAKKAKKQAAKKTKSAKQLKPPVKATAKKAAAKTDK